MNLKESFRYQNFLDKLQNETIDSMVSPDHCLGQTNVHHIKDVNPDGEDKTEIVEVDEFHSNDKLINFYIRLIEEKEKLTNAIGKAKQTIPFDIESAIATNRFRQNLNQTIRGMLRHKPVTRTRKGTGYKFNAEGNQMQYYYDIDAVYEDLYDRESAKKTMRDVIVKADKVSAEIDSAMINTQVEYDPPWDVNEVWFDVVAEFEG